MSKKKHFKHVIEVQTYAQLKTSFDRIAEALGIEFPQKEKKKIIRQIVGITKAMVAAEINNLPGKDELKRKGFEIVCRAFKSVIEVLPPNTFMYFDKGSQGLVVIISSKEIATLKSERVDHLLKEM
jgi:hypothetical protein